MLAKRIIDPNDLIGELVWIWTRWDERDKILGILAEYHPHDTHPFVLQGGLTGLQCRPVKQEEIRFYTGD